MPVPGCQGCASRAIYVLTCVDCAIRLVASAPEGPLRDAMRVHIRTTLSATQFEALMAAWKGVERDAARP